MSAARHIEGQLNLADELVRTTKLWLLDSLLAINKPPATLYESMTALISLLPIWNTAATEGNLTSSIEKNAQRLKASLSDQAADKETAVLCDLKSSIDSMGSLESEKKEKLSFLIGCYEALNKIPPDFNEYNLEADEFPGKEPCIRIFYVLKERLVEYSADKKPALGLKSKSLKKQLQACIRSCTQPPAQKSPPTFSTPLVYSYLDEAGTALVTTPESIGGPIRTNEQTAAHEVPRPRSTSPLPPLEIVYPTPPPLSKQRATNTKPQASHQSATQAANPQVVLDEESTLSKYHRACLTYKIHLLAQIHYEIGKHMKRSPQSPLFRMLKLSEADLPVTLTNKLTVLYPRAKEGVQQGGFFNALANGAKNFAGNLLNLEFNNPTKDDINHAISNLKHPIYALLDKTDSFKEVWEKYKIVKTLSETKSTAEFHKILSVDRIRHTLTVRRDSYLMTFIKTCGLVVATILGLPLLLVGGAYLGYRSLFGSRATEGHKFLKAIDEIKEDARWAKKPPRSCC